MKFSYNWLRELVPGLETKPKSLMQSITMKTAECEGVEEVGLLLASASRARVVNVEPIEGGGHNRKAVVETERFGTKTVVCGAANCRAGLETVYVAIGKKVVSGVESDGMLASGAELGVNRDHSGIVELGSWDPRLQPDAVIEVDNKSLTHRPDLWGHFGMAREVAAIVKRPLRDPVDMRRLPTAGLGTVEVEIADFALCPRYSALVFENATVRPSPLWLQYRLEAIGLNPINNIVDVTNYVMSELAQPMHAFDADRLQGGRIFVRPAKAGEKIVALNDESYDLGPSNLVIADASGPVAIAGVIGGLHSAIDYTTTRLVFESANFQAASVRKTSSQLKLRTDASMRFEKAQDPVNTVRGLSRAVELLEEVSPGIRLVGGLVDVKAPLKTSPPIELPIDWLSRKLGRVVTEAEVRELLEGLEFQVACDVPGILMVTVPSWRATKDISIKDDLLEEVGRIIGYDAIEPRPPLVAAVPPPEFPERRFYRAVRSMAAAQGFTEAYNYSFLSEEAAARVKLAAEEHLRVANPIASDQTLMRVSLLPGILKNIAENSKHFGVFRLFEIGREIHKKASGLPLEVPHFIAVSFAREGDGSAGLFELKRLAECLMPGATVVPAAPLPFEHPERAGEVLWRGESVGRLFELHPAVQPEGRAAVVDADLAKILRLHPGEPKYQALRRFPTSAFDLSVVTPLRETVGVIESRLREAAGEDVIAIEYVRQYAGPPLPDDRKSISYRLTAGAPDRTLSSEEVTVIRNRVIQAMHASGYELRV